MQDFQGPLCPCTLRISFVQSPMEFYLGKEGAMIFSKHISKNIGSGKNQNLIGLDIGSSAIKIARISLANNVVYLDNFGVIPTPLGAIRDGRILDGKALGNAVTHLLDQMGLSQPSVFPGVAMAVGRSCAMIKRFPSFTGSHAELEQIIFAQAEEYFAHDLDSLNMDYDFIFSEDKYSDQVEVITAGVKQEWVKERTAWAASAGLGVGVLDVEVFALKNIHEFVCRNSTGKPKDPPANSLRENSQKDLQEVRETDFANQKDFATLSIDMGEEGCSLMFLVNGDPVLVRENLSGTWQIHQQIQSAMSVDREQSRGLLEQKNILEPDTDAPLFTEIIEDSVQAWCMEIQDQIRFFHDEYAHWHVEQILLSGGGAFIPEFQDLLAARTLIPVKIFDPFDGIRLDRAKFFPSASAVSGSQGAIALGLALRKVEDK